MMDYPCGNCGDCSFSRFGSMMRRDDTQTRRPIYQMITHSVSLQIRRMAIANWTCVSWVAYAPGTIAVNVTWIKREFNSCQMHRSMYTSIFNRFPVIQAVKSKGRHFSTFVAHFSLPVYAPGTIAVNVTWIEREFSACQTPRSMYPSIFNRFWDIASYWSKIAKFSHPTSV